MGSFSISHWLVILAVVVLLFGAKKYQNLPKVLVKVLKILKKPLKKMKQKRMLIKLKSKLKRQQLQQQPVQQRILTIKKRKVSGIEKIGYSCY